MSSVANGLGSQICPASPLDQMAKHAWTSSTTMAAMPIMPHPSSSPREATGLSIPAWIGTVQRTTNLRDQETSALDKSLDFLRYPEEQSLLK